MPRFTRTEEVMLLSFKALDMFLIEWISGARMCQRFFITAHIAYYWKWDNMKFYLEISVCNFY